MKNILLGFILLIAFAAQAQTTTVQMGTIPLMYKGDSVYKEGQGISHSWNGDPLNKDQNGIIVNVRMRFYVLHGSDTAYLDTVSTGPLLPVNPWVSYIDQMIAKPGLMVDSVTTLPAYPNSSGAYPPRAVDSYKFWCKKFTNVFDAIDEEIGILNKSGDL